MGPMQETEHSSNSGTERVPYVVATRRTWVARLRSAAVPLLVLGAVGMFYAREYVLQRAVAADISAIRLDAKALVEEAARTTAAVRELTRTVNPKYDHVTCPAQNGRAEVDLGVPSPCPNPDDGQCVRGDMPLSVAQARCTAGKL